MKCYRISRWLYLHHLKPLSLLLKGFIRVIFGGVIPPSAQIGEGTFITYHGLGVVIHQSAVIGCNCIIRQNVTIAGATKRDGGAGAPIIGNNVEINTGAVVVGPITIGNNVRIGANAVVLSNIPDNCTAVGIPAKPVKYNDLKSFHISI